MIKKLLSISGILAMAMTLCLVGGVDATGNNVVFTSDTSMNIYRIGTTSASDLVVEAGSQVAGIARGTDRVTITLESGSDITFKSAGNQVMTVTNCDAAYATFTAGATSMMHIVHNDLCDDNVVLTIGTGGLTEANVKAVPLTAGALAADTEYTVTFRTVSALASSDKIKLVFGTGYTIADSGGSAVVTDNGTPITPTLTTSSSSKEVILTLDSAVTASSVIVIDLTSVVTNPALASSAYNAAGDPTMSVLGIDFYTTTSGGTTIDSLAGQTPYNRIIELEPGWNIFAPSQALETPLYTTVLTPIIDYVRTIYTLTRADAGVMSWTTPDGMTIDPLYGYAIYITGSVTQKLPLDFAKETPSNSKDSRSLAYKGWYLIGYMGSDTDGYMNAQSYCLDGLMGTNATNDEDFTAIYDETGTTAGEAPSDHKFGDATEEAAADGDGTSMRFYQDYGYSVLTITDDLVLSGLREENHPAL